MSNTTVLVVDDDPQLRRVMRASLADLGYVVADARTGEEALEKVHEHAPDLILLDLNMPGMGGLAACRKLRETGDVPIIILSVRDSEMDKVNALDAGADDYVTKPFGVQELMARIRAAMRRTHAAGGDGPVLVQSGGLEIDFEARRVTVEGKTVRLTPKEFDLLRLLVSNANKAVPHRRLLQAVWGPEYGDELEYLRVFVNQLRKKLEPVPSKPVYLLTEPWVGYRFALPEGALVR